MTDNQPETMPVRPVERQIILDDIHVRQDGDGRTVEAYAAVFGHRSEIRDQDGHYMEELDPASFNRTIQHKGPAGFGVLFNHGRTVDGTPNPYATMPIGVPLEVRADERGVFTATRYLDNPLAEDVLGAIKAGALKAQSFSGRFLRSIRSYPGGSSRAKSTPLITRMEVDMREYGPAVFAAYDGAAILGTRSTGLLEPSPLAVLFTRGLMALPREEALAWLQQFETGTTPLLGDTEPATGGTPEGTATEADVESPDPDTEPDPEHSARMAELRERYERLRGRMRVE